MSEDKAGWSKETVYQIWNDKSGERLEVGDDRDGFGLVEIRSYTSKGKLESCITFPMEVVTSLIDSLKNWEPS